MIGRLKAILIIFFVFLSFPAISQNSKPDPFKVDSIFSLKLTPALRIPLGRATYFLSLLAFEASIGASWQLVLRFKLGEFVHIRGGIKWHTSIGR